jgi:hypothetical protein
MNKMERSVLSGYVAILSVFVDTPTSVHIHIKLYTTLSVLFLLSSLIF